MLKDYSIDDLHQLATAELQSDPDAVATLNAMYSDIREQYVAIFEMLRARAEQHS